MLRWLARSIYLVLVQTIAGLAALLLLLYFAVNSPSAAGRISALLTQVLPGDLQVAAIRWGPSPGRIALLGLQIATPAGQPVVQVQLAEVEVALSPLINALVSGRRVLPLQIERLRVHGGDVRLENDALGRLLLTQAFADPDEPPDPSPGTPLKLDVADLEVTDTAFLLQQEAIRIRLRGAGFRGSFSLHQDGEQVDVTYAARNLQVTEANVVVAAMRDLPPLPPLLIRVAKVEGNLLKVKVDGIDLYLLRPALAHDQPIDHGARWYEPASLVDGVVLGASARMLLLPEVRIDARDLDLATSTRAPFFGQMLGPSFDAAVTMAGGFALTPETGFTAHGDVAGWGKMSGFQTDFLRGKLFVETTGPGAQGVRVKATDLDVRAYGGRMTSPDLRYAMAADDQTMLVTGAFRIDGMSAAGPLLSEAVAMSGSLPLMLQGVLRGDLGMAVRMRLDPERQPALDMDVALAADLALERTGVGTPFLNVVDQVHLSGGMAFGMGPGSEPGQPARLELSLDDALVHTGESGHTPAQLQRRNWIRASGKVDLVGEGTRLQLAAHVPQLADLLAPLGIEGVRGQVELEATELRGGMATPAVGGRLKVRNLEAKGHRIARLDTKIAFDKGTLRLSQLQVATDLAQVSGDVEVGLFQGGGFTRSRQPRTLRVQHLQVRDLDLEKVTKLAGVAGISGIAQLQGGDVRLNLDAPLRSLQVTGHVHVDDLEAGGERFAAVDASVAMRGRQMIVPDLSVVLPDGQTATASVAFDLDKQKWEVSARIPKVELSTLAALRDGKVPIRGRVGLTIAAAGDQKTLEIHTEVEIENLAYDLPRTDPDTGAVLAPQRIDLGSAHLGLDKEARGPAVFRSRQFFRRFRLLPGSQAEFTDQKPQQLVLRIGTAGAIDPFAVLGMPAPTGMTTRVEAEVATLLDLRPGKPLFRIEVNLPPGGVFADLGSGLQPLRTTSPSEIVVTPGGITIGSIWFDLGRHPLEACGSYTYGDKEAKTKDLLLLFLSGTVDIPRIGVLTQSLASIDMRMDILSDPLVAADERSNCLESARTGKGRLRVEGPLDALRVQGTVQTRQSRISPRRFGRDIVIAEGGRLSVSTAPNGKSMTVLIPRHHRLAGALEDGRFALWGTALLRQVTTGVGDAAVTAWVPDTVDIELEGADVPQSVPKMLTMTLSPDLQFRGTRLNDPDARRMRLTGTVDVPEGTFYKSFDALASIAGNVQGREVEQVSQPITESMPWLTEVELDLAIRGSNFEIASRFPLGRTDLVTDFNLRVTGHLSPGASMIDGLRVYDRANVTPGTGSQITYAINNLIFEVDRGSLDFNGDIKRPYIDLVLKADIPDKSSGGSGRSASGLFQGLSTDSNNSGKMITVFVTITGFFSEDTEELDIRFSSNEGDTPADVQSLILTGRRLTDASKGGQVAFNTDFVVGALGKQIAQKVLKRIGIADELDVQVDPASGTTTAEASKRVGRNILLAVKVEAGLGQAAKYSATFDWRLADRLSFNGLFRRQPDLTQDTKLVDVFDGRIRYKVLLD